MAVSTINQEVMHLPVHLKCKNIATMALCLLMNADEDNEIKYAEVQRRVG
jgi:hypothetical protein